MPPQAGERSHGSGHQHEGGDSLRERAVRGDRPAEVAVRRVVTRCVPGQPHGIRRSARVRILPAGAESLCHGPGICNCAMTQILIMG